MVKTTHCIPFRVCKVIPRENSYASYPRARGCVVAAQRRLTHMFIIGMKIVVTSRNYENANFPGIRHYTLKSDSKRHAIMPNNSKVRTVVLFEKLKTVLIGASLGVRTILVDI